MKCVHVACLMTYTSWSHAFSCIFGERDRLHNNMHGRKFTPEQVDPAQATPE